MPGRHLPGTSKARAYSHLNTATQANKSALSPDFLPGQEPSINMYSTLAPRGSTMNQALQPLIAVIIALTCTSCQHDSSSSISPAQEYALAACDTFTRVAEPTLSPDERKQVIHQAIKDAQQAKDADLGFEGLLNSLLTLDEYFDKMGYLEPLSDSQLQGYGVYGGAVSDECLAAGQRP